MASISSMAYEPTGPQMKKLERSQTICHFLCLRNNKLFCHGISFHCCTRSFLQLLDTGKNVLVGLLAKNALPGTALGSVWTSWSAGTMGYRKSHPEDTSVVDLLRHGRPFKLFAHRWVSLSNHRWHKIFWELPNRDKHHFEKQLQQGLLLTGIVEIGIKSRSDTRNIFHPSSSQE